MSDQKTHQPEFRECAIYVLSCLVQALAKSGERWELQFDSEKSVLIRNRDRNSETIVEIHVNNGVPTCITHGKLWTQHDRDRWLQKYGGCLRHMVEVINGTAPGESGMVVLFEA